MNQNLAPAIKHRTWRHLLRDFVSAHPQLLGLTERDLQLALTPAVSLAWWIATYQPTLLGREHLTVALPGVGSIECVDGGRWFNFVPWFLGLPNLKVSSVLIGDEIWKTPKRGRRSAKGITSVAGRLVKNQTPPEVFHGTLGQWCRSVGPDIALDACVLFSPGFSDTPQSWLTNEELLPLFKQKIPIGVFGYSELDVLEDQKFLNLCDVEFDRKGAIPVNNPWGLAHQLQSAIGGLANWAWKLTPTEWLNPPTFDHPMLKEYPTLMSQLDFEGMGGDEGLVELGAAVPIKGPNGLDHVIVLPDGWVIVQSTGELLATDEDSLEQLSPPIKIPLKHLKGCPSDTDLVDRMFWAMKLYRYVVMPALEAHEGSQDGVPDDESDGDFTEEDLFELMNQMLAGDEGLETLVNQMRAQGGLHGPTHPSWHDLLATLDWPIKGYRDSPERLAAAFVTQAARRRTWLPVVCEAYMMHPGDTPDVLAEEAKEVVSKQNPKGALLVFKGMPFREHNGHRYSFGGMLWWNGAWSEFAINEHTHSVDDIIDQVESGFNFETGDPKYADRGSRVAIPFGLACHGVDPNTHKKVITLKLGDWAFPIPG